MGAPITIFVIAGEGGHLEQAHRVLSVLRQDLKLGARCVLITDIETERVGEFDDCWVVKTCAPKHRSSSFADFCTYLSSSIGCIWRMARHHKVRVAIVTGPGFAFLPALGAKILGAQLYVFESWSRFENRSNCGKVLYHLSNKFFIQHKELQPLYPKAIWVGLL